MRRESVEAAEGVRQNEGHIVWRAAHWSSLASTLCKFFVLITQSSDGILVPSVNVPAEALAEQ